MNKKIIAGTLAGLVGLGTYLQFGRPSIESVVKREFDSFPTEIEGAKSVKKYGTEGAQYCLVHIRETHGPNFYEGKKYGSDEKEAENTKVQNDIYLILSHLITNNGLKKVYSESFEPITEHINYLARAKQIYDSADAQKKQRMFNDAFGVFKLFYQGRLLPIPAENTEINLAAKKEVETYENRTIGALVSRTLMDGREDALLEIIAKKSAQMAVTTYGASHSWEDNIERWNKIHPDKKFSLIEITPKNLPIIFRHTYTPNESGEFELKGWRD